MARKVVVIPGDDAAPEAILPTVDILRSISPGLDIQIPLTGKEAMAKRGTGFPPEAREAIDGADAVLFGATSGASTEAAGYMRFGKQLFANVRPFKWVKGFNSPMKHPEGIDWVMVREGLEDLYCAIGGPLSELAKLDIGDRGFTKLDLTRHGGYSLKIITREGTAKVAKFGCELAAMRKAYGSPGKVTVPVKVALLKTTDGLFRDVVRETVARYPGLTYEELAVDNFCNLIVINPQQLDVVIIPNQYGDILSDGAAATIGGLGVCPSGIFSDTFAYFEPIHGTAPDIAGKNIINPTASILSAKMMLEYLGMQDEASHLEAAVNRVYHEGKVLTPDQGGTASTSEFCQAVKSKL